MMASSDISKIENNRQPVRISKPTQPIQTGKKEEKEKDILERGMSKSGDSQDIRSHRLEIGKTVEVFKNTTYWGYALITFVVIFSGFQQDIFSVDVWIQALLIGSVVGNNIIRVLKQLSGSKILDSTGF